VTVILLSCSYDDREFVRVGYYVNNEYTDPALNDEPPAKPEMDKIRRNILADKPRVTRFQIKWDSEESAPSEFPPEQPDVDAQEDDGAAYGAEEEEEEEEEAAVEVEETGGAAKAGGEDADMEGAENTNGKEEDEESDAGSEDLEAESDGDDEEDLEEEEGEGEGGEDMEMDDANAQPAQPAQHQQQAADVMVH
jgi:histone chaperone ASF1